MMMWIGLHAVSRTLESYLKTTDFRLPCIALQPTAGIQWLAFN
ncbi:hypothetical protein RBSWK_02197 [Rhodopirellula baltica SWK14]|uniref:Uncharacterized protein n=1 Tax=Rhodopirellula baltica SWK14 TaxID=993516 RepID=L7CLX6_RHOBT|nr:hypothetical protein RBSWK_02197 [Rhodopirellula baltica SWK14]